MLQTGIGYTLTFNDGDYDHWSEADRECFFKLVHKAYNEFRIIRGNEFSRGPKVKIKATFRTTT